MKKWAAEFKREGESVGDDGRSGHPKDVTTDDNFNIISLQGNALSPSMFKLSYPFKIEGLFLVPKYSFTASMTPSLLAYCVPRRWDFSFGRQTEPYRENMGDEEGFQIHIQCQQSW